MELVIHTKNNIYSYKSEEDIKDVQTQLDGREWIMLPEEVVDSRIETAYHPLKDNTKRWLATTKSIPIIHISKIEDIKLMTTTYTPSNKEG